jgi:hypothetical protein
VTQGAMSRDMTKIGWFVTPEALKLLALNVADS